MAQFTTPRRAATFLDVGHNYLYRLLYEGKLDAKKVNGHWEIDTASVAAYKRKRNRKLTRRK